jgi:twitching motility protein PilT
MLDLQELLRFTAEHRASDLHLKVGSPPYLRVDGNMAATSFDRVEAADTERMVFAILPKARADEFVASCEASFAYGVAGVGRFRVSAFRQRGVVGLVFRRVLPGIPSFESLGLPSIVAELTQQRHGIILITGPAASGRTTTMASMVDAINSSRASNIITIEDPIEILHADKMSIVSQREIGTDTRDYGEAVWRAMRQDPDVIAIGDASDHETMSAVLAAAETGHLVLATMRTRNAAETLNRVVDFFPPFQHRQVRHTLAHLLRGIVSQRLLERADGRGRVAAVEVLTNTARIAERILEPEAKGTLEEVMSDGEYHGMQTFDQSLFSLYKNGLVSLRDAESIATYPNEFRIALQSAGLLGS